MRASVEQTDLVTEIVTAVKTAQRWKVMGERLQAIARSWSYQALRANGLNIQGLGAVMLPCTTWHCHWLLLVRMLAEGFTNG